MHVRWPIKSIGYYTFQTLTIAALALAITTSPARSDNEIWGKRIYQRPIDNQHQIVVDERGDGAGLQGLEYCWRLLKIGETDGPVLFSVSGVQLGSGTGYLFDRIDVLYADVKGDDLVTVFNQRQECWAYVAHRNKDGSIKSKPDTNIMIGVARAMKAAQIKQADQKFYLTLADEKKRSLRFQLQARASNPDVFYWARIPSTMAAATRD